MKEREAIRKITKLIQKDIRKKGLVKTGKLVGSIDGKFVKSKDNISFEIYAVDYYVYLDDGTRYIQPYNITSDVYESDDFIEIMEDIYEEWLNNKIDKMLIKNKQK